MKQQFIKKYYIDHLSKVSRFLKDFENDKKRKRVVDVSVAIVYKKARYQIIIIYEKLDEEEELEQKLFVNWKEADTIEELERWQEEEKEKRDEEVVSNIFIFKTFLSEKKYEALITFKLLEK